MVEISFGQNVGSTHSPLTHVHTLGNKKVNMNIITRVVRPTAAGVPSNFGGFFFVMVKLRQCRRVCGAGVQAVLTLSLMPLTQKKPIIHSSTVRPEPAARHRAAFVSSVHWLRGHMGTRGIPSLPPSLSERGVKVTRAHPPMSNTTHDDAKRHGRPFWRGFGLFSGFSFETSVGEEDEAEKYVSTIWNWTARTGRALCHWGPPLGVLPNLLNASIAMPLRSLMFACLIHEVERKKEPYSGSGESYWKWKWNHKSWNIFQQILLSPNFSIK